MKLLLLLLMMFQGTVFAEAFCALRDPMAQIKQLFPEKTSQLSIVKAINDDIRQQVQTKLPNNDLHFGELGRHTLYVIFKEQQILGYIHVRSEQSFWGLVEVIWAIDRDFTIIDFAFQRCRSPKKTLIEQSEFRQMFIGKNLQQLQTYLSADGVSANRLLLEQAKRAPELANVLLRCALKTLLLTQLVWQEELNTVMTASLNVVNK